MAGRPEGVLPRQPVGSLRLSQRFVILGLDPRTHALTVAEECGQSEFRTAASR